MSLPKIFQRLSRECFALLVIFGLAFTFQAPSYAACLPSCNNNAVCAQRFDACPNYQAGDLAYLLVRTNPAQADKPVKRDRI